MKNYLTRIFAAGLLIFCVPVFAMEEVSSEELDAMIIDPQEGEVLCCNENDVLGLVDLYMDTETDLDSHYEQLLVEGIDFLDSSKVNSKVLEKLNKSKESSFKKRKILAGSILNWAVSHEKKDTMKEMYKSFVQEDILRKEDSFSDDGIDVLHSYYRLDPESALRCIEYFSKKRAVEYISQAQFSNKVKDDSLRLFGMLYQYKSKKFEEYAAQVLKDKLDSLLCVVFAHPQRMKELRGSMLDFDTIMEKVFESALTIDDEGRSSDAFKVLLERGQDYHVAYENRISQLLPDYIKKFPYKDRGLRALFDSPSEFLRSESVSTLIEYVASFDKRADSYSYQSCVNDLFEKKSEKNAEELDLYGKLYNSFKKHGYSADYGVQKLFLHLQQSGASQLNSRALMGEYLNLSPEFLKNSTQVPLKEFVTGALQQALVTETIAFDRLSSVVASAQKTGLQQYIAQNFLKQFKKASVVREDVSLKEREQFLEDLIRDNGDSLDISELVGNIPESVFKTYAQQLLAAMNPNQTYYAHFAARRALAELHKEHEDLPENPRVVSDRYSRLYNPFNWYGKRTKSEVHITVKQEFMHPTVPAGDLCFGWHDSRQGPDTEYCFYACDKKTGYPVWVAPFENKKREGLLHGIWQDFVYCVTDDGVIMQFDKNNGQHVSTITPSIQDTSIKKFHITPQGMLYLVTQKNITTIDLQGGREIITPMPEYANENYASFVGEKLVLPNYKTHDLFLIGRDSISNIKTPNSDHFDHPRVIGNDDLLVYTYDAGTRQDSLVGVNPQTGAQLWKYDPDAELQGMPKFSADGSKLFVLTEKKLIALSLQHQTIQGQPCVLWETSLEEKFSNKINQILPSEDGMKIYGIQEDYGKLYQFDIQTGSATYLYDANLGRIQKLVGTCEDKVYIQGIHF